MSDTLTGIADCSDLTVLFCENIADDDFIWSVQTSTTGLLNFLFNPAAWVNSLARCSGWRSIEGDPMPAATRPKPFEIRIDQPPASVVDSSKVIIQGISTTGVVTIRPGSTAAFELIPCLSPVRDFISAQY
ncbi:MAG TPA: hypothetical protein VG820_09360, partial [Fimbriimonadaceae bacterium]|nr:hypothetical protein [Fimbriimonadaceae bacterium]